MIGPGTGREPAPASVPRHADLRRRLGPCRRCSPSIHRWCLRDHPNVYAEVAVAPDDRASPSRSPGWLEPTSRPTPRRRLGHRRGSGGHSRPGRRDSTITSTGRPLLTGRPVTYEGQEASTRSWTRRRGSSGLQTIEATAAVTGRARSLRRAAATGVDRSAGRADHSSKASSIPRPGLRRRQRAIARSPELTRRANRRAYRLYAEPDQRQAAPRRSSQTGDEAWRAMARRSRPRSGRRRTRAHVRRRRRSLAGTRPRAWRTSDPLLTAAESTAEEQRRQCRTTRGPHRQDGTRAERPGHRAPRPALAV